MTSRLHDAPPASMGRRFAAGLLDIGAWCVVGGWALVLGAQRSSLVLLELGIGLTGALVLAQWILHGQRGWTLGRLAVGVRTVDVETREPIGMPRVLLRALVIAAGALVALVGALVVLCSPFVDRTGRNRGWHDRAARDEVLDVRASAPSPYAVEPPRPSRTAEPARRPDRVPAAVPLWANASPPGPRVVGDGGPPSLVLAPLSPHRSGPDLDTRAMPVLRPGFGYGLDPELELTRAVQAPLPPEPEPEPDRPGAEFELSDGRTVWIERTALVGRNPGSAVSVQLVRVGDPTRSVSKTHLQIGVEPSGVWVADRGSTNGTLVTLPDGAQVVCRVDQRVRLRVGSTVVFGDSSMRLVRLPVTPAEA